jgi:hypothetical protein
VRPNPGEPRRIAGAPVQDIELPLATMDEIEASLIEDVLP